MKSKFLVSVVIIPGLFLFINMALYAEEKDNQANIYRRFSAIQCDSLVKANETNPNFVILDVRTPGEWNNYHLSGSINHSTGNATFDAELAALPKHKTYLLHCQSGSRSAGAFAKMKTLGFAEVYEMIGGISAWRSAGLPTTTLTAPKLMVVSILKTTKNADSDTMLITVTNRANGILSFSNLGFPVNQKVDNNFESTRTLNGAEDYTFYVVHPASLNDFTDITLESNGGIIFLKLGNSLKICESQFPVAWYDNQLDAPGIYFQKLFNTTDGYDSIITIELVIKPQDTITLDTTVIINDLPFIWRDKEYFFAGHYTDTLACDSIFILNLNTITTMVSSQTDIQLKLYPNPVSDRLFVDAGNETIEEITILDFAGKLLTNLQIAGLRENIDVSVFRDGIYLARISTSNGIFTKKFVVKH